MKVERGAASVAGVAVVVVGAFLVVGGLLFVIGAVGVQDLPSFLLSDIQLPCPSSVTMTLGSGQKVVLPLASESVAQSIYGQSPLAVWGPFDGNIGQTLNAPTSPIPLGFIASDASGDPPVYGYELGYYWQPFGGCYKIQRTATTATSTSSAASTSTAAVQTTTVTATGPQGQSAPSPRAYVPSPPPSYPGWLDQLVGWTGLLIGVVAIDVGSALSSMGRPRQAPASTRR